MLLVGLPWHGSLRCLILILLRASKQDAKCLLWSSSKAKEAAKCRLSNFEPQAKPRKMQNASSSRAKEDAKCKLSNFEAQAKPRMPTVGYCNLKSRCLLLQAGCGEHNSSNEIWSLDQSSHICQASLQQLLQSLKLSKARWLKWDRLKGCKSYSKAWSFARCSWLKWDRLKGCNGYFEAWR